MRIRTLCLVLGILLSVAVVKADEESLWQLEASVLPGSTLLRRKRLERGFVLV